MTPRFTLEEPAKKPTTAGEPQTKTAPAKAPAPDAKPTAPAAAKPAATTEAKVAAPTDAQAKPTAGAKPGAPSPTPQTKMPTDPEQEYREWKWQQKQKERKMRDQQRFESEKLKYPGLTQEDYDMRQKRHATEPTFGSLQEEQEYKWQMKQLREQAKQKPYGASKHQQQPIYDKEQPQTAPMMGHHDSGHPMRSYYPTQITHAYQTQDNDEMELEHHLEAHHEHDLFDFEDPLSDSSYDDLDEETGIYHDKNPHHNPS